MQHHFLEGVNRPVWGVNRQSAAIITAMPRPGNAVVSVSYQELLQSPLSLEMVDEALQYQKTHKYELLFPDTGPFARDRYPKQLEFFRMGAQYRERMFRAGNQVGKSLAGCYEDTAHLTGQYPSWWEGKRFLSPVKLWACAETAKKVREVLQAKLFGATEDGCVVDHANDRAVLEQLASIQMVDVCLPCQTP